MNFGTRAASALFSSMIVLAACSNSDAPPPANNTPPPPVLSGPIYQPFTSTTGGTTTIGGSDGVATMTVRTDSTGVTDVVPGTGSLVRATGGLSVDDGTFAFNDPSGLSTAGFYRDGASVIAPTDAIVDTSDYEFVEAYNHDYDAAGLSYEADGFMGIVTQPGDVPTAGRATYRGDAYATIENSSGTVVLRDGQATVGANFATRTVEATLGNFSSVTDGAGNRTSNPIDEVLLIGMGISGNTFSGSTVATTGAVGGVVGSAPNMSVTGAFFGFDRRNGRPDEVAGVFQSEGSDGSITGGFVAD